MGPVPHLVVRVLLVLAVLLALPASAGAHASLTSSEPAADSVVEVAPGEVTLVFSGNVVAGPGTIQVFGPNQANVETGAPTPAKGTSISQSFDGSQTGTYGVGYRVSSEDGHVINGSFTFSVGEEGGDGAAAASDAGSVDRSLQVAFSTARFVEVVALLLAAGGGLFACVIAPGWRPRLLVTSLVVLLLAYGAGFLIDTAILQGTSIREAFDMDALAATADTPFGRSLKLRALVALVAIGPALLLRANTSLPDAARYALATVFVGLAASLSITGHAVTTEPTWLRMPLDMVHVTAAAIWIGGLLQLAYLAPFATTYVDAIARFSRVAFASVVVILVTGAYATYAELGTSFGELVDSTYGRLIVAKLALYLGTMPLAWNNMSAFVPQIARRPEDAPRMLRQYVWREFFLVIVVVALTVWLIATPQPE
jgi:copper transport protein